MVIALLWCRSPWTGSADCAAGVGIGVELAGSCCSHCDCGGLLLIVLLYLDLVGTVVTDCGAALPVGVGCW